LHGVYEDPATGSANVALIGLLAHLRPESSLRLEAAVGQGVDLGRPSPLNAALWRLRRRGRGFWVIPLDFTCVWTRRVGSGLEPEFGAGRVCGCRDGCEYWG